jgi:hypothetical protein
MARPYSADTTEQMRLFALLSLALVFAAPAAAAGPRFGLFDLNDLARASQNSYGDIKVAQRATALRGTVVRCGASCRFGTGWLAFAKAPGLNAGDVVSAKAHSGRIGWSVDLRLTARGLARWTAFSKIAAQGAKSSGFPDVLAVVVNGEILAVPYANDVRYKNGTLELVGFSRAAALRAAKTLG